MRRRTVEHGRFADASGGRYVEDADLCGVPDGHVERTAGDRHAVTAHLHLVST